MPDENRYEKNKYGRNAVLEELNSCIYICDRALAEKAKVLHNGI